MKKRQYKQKQGKNKYLRQIGYKYDKKLKKNIDVTKSICIGKYINDENGNEKLIPTIPPNLAFDDDFSDYIFNYYYKNENVNFIETVLSFLRDKGLLFNEILDLSSTLLAKIILKSQKKIRNIIEEFGGEYSIPIELYIMEEDVIYVCVKKDGTNSMVSKVLKCDPYKFLEKFENIQKVNCDIYYMCPFSMIDYELTENYNNLYEMDEEKQRYLRSKLIKILSEL